MTINTQSRHTRWVDVSDPTELPNVSGAAIQDAALQLGDTCYSISDTTLYFCTTATEQSAVWASGGGSSSPFEVDATDNEVQPATANIGRGFIVGSQDMDDSGVSNDARMFFEKATGAFRAGLVTGTHWDSASRGDNSCAVGWNNTASGNESFASGSNNSATGSQAHAVGTACTASGDTSHAEGLNSVASGDYSHAEGKDSQATDEAAHAEGYNTYSIGPNSHSEGYRVYAGNSGFLYRYTGGDHAEGNSTKAYGTYGSHAEGYSTIASGIASHAEGYDTTASGASPGSSPSQGGAHAEGVESLASGIYGSHAEGRNTVASGSSAHAQGFYTTASGDNSFSSGQRSVARLDQSEATAGNDFVASGDGQNLKISAGTTTTNATPKELSLDYDQASSDIAILDGTSWAFSVRVLGRDGTPAGGTDSYCAFFNGLIKRSGTAVSLIPGPSPLSPYLTLSEAGAATWSAVVKDDTGGNFNIEVTGEVAKTIRWVAEIQVTEISTS